MTVRRLKTYTGETGYVYQYYFVGKRPAIANDPAAPATEFVFDVTSDRKQTFAVSIFVQDVAVAAWQAQHERNVVDAELYASAKMRLFRAFDKIEDLMEQGRRLVVDAEELEELLALVGVD
ncbi:MAG: hypothetical protein ACXVZV_05480 [Terriglobales bacterium]